MFKKTLSFALAALLVIFSAALPALADRLGVSRKTLSTIVNERAAVTPDMALRLSRAFKTSPELWLNMQKSYDLWTAEHEDTGWAEVMPIPGLNAAAGEQARG